MKNITDREIRFAKMGFSRLTRTRRRLLAVWKFLLSFRRTDWKLEDYPVDTVRQDVPSNNETLPEWRKIPPFRAKIINWSEVSATGSTPADAVRRLEEKFESIRIERASMPRPGKHVPADVKFADRGRIAAHEDLAQEFIREVLGLEWAFVSDESSLWDFTSEDSLDLYYSRISARYGVDVCAADNGNLPEILELIARSREIEKTL
jgi:hypothetical protein